MILQINDAPIRITISAKQSQFPGQIFHRRWREAVVPYVRHDEIPASRGKYLDG